jgi:hypothetical protein
LLWDEPILTAEAFGPAFGAPAPAPISGAAGDSKDSAAAGGAAGDAAAAAADAVPDLGEVLGETIRERFATSTILTIAHRIATIRAADRVMVLTGGQIAEFDTPAKLMADPNSLLTALLAGASA